MVFYAQRAPEKYDRCVEKVKRKSPKVNPYAVCHKAVTVGRTGVVFYGLGGSRQVATWTKSSGQ